MKKAKKILCTLLVVVMCVMSVPMEGVVNTQWPDLPEIGFSKWFDWDIDFSSWFSSKAKAAEELTYGDFKYTVKDDGTVSITGYSGSAISVELPSIIDSKSVTSIGQKAFYRNEVLETIIIPNTVTSIGTSAFEDCSSLETISLPKSVTSIGNYAFENCKNLKYITINNSTCKIEKNSFKNANNVNFVCHLNSLATIYAIDNNIAYSTINANDTSSYIAIEKTNSRYFADVNSVSANGYINLTVDYKVLDTSWSSTSNKNIVIKVPTGTNLIEGSIRVENDICTNYTYNEDTMKLTIPITLSEGTIKLSTKAVESRDIRSYALLSYKYNKTTIQEVIGVIDEGIEALTVYTEKITSSKTIKVEGVAPVQTQVNIYIDDILYTTVTANKVGAYLANITLSPESAEQTFQIKATCVTNSGDTIDAHSTVKYLEKAPELTGFVFYINSDNDKGIDLFAYSQKGIRPSITHTGSQHPYKFVITYENPESIESLYVTSTRNNVKKSMPATYDKATGTFIAQGYFDENNKTYVPGTLGIEYNLSHNDILAGQNVDFNNLKNYLNDDLVNNAVVNSTPTKVGSYGTIDLSGVSKDLANVVLNYSIDALDESAGTNLGDLMSMAGVVKKVFSYTVPGVNDSKYWVSLDIRDPKTYTMIVSDATNVAKTAVRLKLSATEFNEAVGGLSYVELSDLADKLSDYATVAKVVYEAYGIYSDHDDLCNQIMQSSTIKDKSVALEKAEELKSDRLAFLLLTTTLPLLVASGPMTGPALLFTGMISAMTAVSGFFWDYRITDILGGIFKIKWHIDPSGYVYDIDTNERLAGVTTTAYCIEYDDSDDFWENKPKNTEYGTTWNAAEYSQENPLTTDSEGRYAWDVPEGWWRVKYEKEGYETTWSDWLPVPPPQLDVNVGMRKTASHTHSYTSSQINSTCTQPGSIIYTCSCGDTYTETINPTGHSFDGTRCTTCGYDRSVECTCNCHKGGISGFFFKLINFFQKLFGNNKVCACGKVH